MRAILQVADRSGLWPLIGGGCHPARDAGGAIERAGFTIERCERVPFSPNPPVLWCRTSSESREATSARPARGGAPARAVHRVVVGLSSWSR
jgi:hypothetical protein